MAHLLGVYEMTLSVFVQALSPLKLYDYFHDDAHILNHYAEAHHSFLHLLSSCTPTHITIRSCLYFEVPHVILSYCYIDLKIFK